MTAFLLQSVVLEPGDLADLRPSAHEAGERPIGSVGISLGEAGSLSLQSYSPDVLSAVAAAFFVAANRLTRLLGNSARVETAPGADALGEAAAGAAEGERADGIAVPAPPSNLEDDEVVEATIYCWADDSKPCTCRGGDDCPWQWQEDSAVVHPEGVQP